MEKTLILIKPEGVERDLLVPILSMLPFSLLGLKLIPNVSAEMLERHYEEHREKNPTLFHGLVEDMKDRPIIAMVLGGEAVVERSRIIIGATNPANAESWSIRGMFCDDTFEKADAEGRPTRTIVHGSATIEAAEIEIPVWFSENELILII